MKQIKEHICKKIKEIQLKIQKIEFFQCLDFCQHFKYDDFYMNFHASVFTKFEFYFVYLYSSYKGSGQTDKNDMKLYVHDFELMVI